MTDRNTDANPENPSPEASPSTRADSRRRFLKQAGTAGMALPVIVTLSGKDLLVRSAKAQSGPGDDNGGGGGPTGPTGPTGEIT